MKEITEDYVSFETAKLLKEKGFDWDESPFYSEQDRDEWRQNNNYAIPNVLYDRNLPFDSETTTLIAPHVSLQMAMKWLREVHNINIEIFYFSDVNPARWAFEIIRLPIGVTVFGEYNERSYEEACEAAIKYCLENLI